MRCPGVWRHPAAPRPDSEAASAAGTVHALTPEDDDEAWEIGADPVPAPVSPPSGAFAEASLWRRARAAVVDAGCSAAVVAFRGAGLGAAPGAGGAVLRRGLDALGRG